MSSHIQVGDYIVIQRQKYTKLQKFGSLEATTALGKDQLELRGLSDQPYSATFKMCPKETKAVGKQGRGGGGGRGGNQRLHTLELCTETELRSIREVLGISASGEDNRHILDNGDSQALGPEDIEQLRDEYNDSSKIIEKIVENSKTFHTKTEYSQEKYLRKKEKKYFEFVQIRRPTVRLIAEIYYRQDAEKVMGLRQDTLSQLISYAGVSAFGQYLLYESGTNGLLPACFLNSMGAGTEATLVHMHPGNVPQRQAMMALNLPQEQLERCISVNIYSVLRQYYQQDGESGGTGVGSDSATSDSCKADVAKESAEVNEPSSKKQKLNSDEEETTESEENSNSKEASVALKEEVPSEQTTAAKALAAAAAAAVGAAQTPSQAQKWQLDNERALAIMRGKKFDSLVVAAKEHPNNIVQTLLPLVKPSRPIVVHNQCREVLMELYMELKANSNVTNLHLTSNWLRMYQILPNRTHPEVNMNGNSGYLLFGYTLSK